MKFSEKLQNLRKEKHLSQEQLADMLDVSRQSVSKWESGTTYPEMDKLLQMCKIFKCTLDDLTNDEVKEVTTKDKKENHIGNLIDAFLEVISRSEKTFKKMNAKQICEVILQMFLVLIVILITRMPIEYISDLVKEVFTNFGDVGKVFTSLWNALVEITYFVFTLVALFYTFKSRCLDKYENLTVEEEYNEEPTKEEKAETKKEPTKEKKAEYKIVSVFGTIIMFFIKIMVAFTAIPFVFSFGAAIFCLVISIIAICNGIFYIGIPMMILGGLALNSLILEIFIYFIFNKKMNGKQILITLLASVVLIGVGGAITAYDISNSSYINNVDSIIKDTQKAIVTKEYDMSDNLLLHNSYNVTFIEDETLKDKVKVQISYYDAYNKLFLDEEQSDNNRFINVNMEELENVNIKTFVSMLKTDLRNKTIHNYGKLYDYEIIVYSSKANIDKIKSNIEAYENQVNEDENDAVINDLEEQISNKDIQLDEALNEIDELKDQNQELQDKINDYQETLKTLID